jgi:hypothetical protein
MDIEVLSSLNSQLSDMNDMLSKQSAAMTSMVNTMSPMQSSFNNLRQSADDLAKSQDDSGNKFDGVSKKTEAATKATQMAEAASAQLSISVNRGLTAISGFTHAVLDVTPGMSKYSSSVAGATEAVASFANILGPFGKVASLLLGAVAGLTTAAFKYSDAVVDTYDTVAKSTGGLGTSAEGLMKLGRNAQLSSKTIGSMAKGITDLGADIRNLGGTSSQGVEMYGKMIAVGDKTLKQYRNLGYTQEQLIEAQTNFVKLNAQVGADMAKHPRDLQKESLKYIDNANRLAEVTGLNEKAQNDALAAAQAQENFNAHMSDLEAQRDSATNDAERKKLDAQIQSERNYAIIAEQLGPAKSKAILSLLSSKGKPIITEETMAALRDAPEILDQINKMKKTGQDQSAELTQSIVDGHKTSMDNGGSAMTGMGQVFSDYAAQHGEDNKTREFAAAQAGKDLSQRKKLAAELIKEEEKKKKQEEGIVAQKGEIESQERTAQLNFDNILKPLSEKLNDMVIKFIPMVTKALGWITRHVPEIEILAKAIGIAIAGLVAVAGVGKVVNTVRSFKDGFSKWMRGESGAIGSSTNPAWVTISEKSGALAAITGESVLPKVRKADLLDKNGKVLQGGALDARMKKLAGAHKQEDGAQNEGSIGSMIEALKYASKNAADIIKGGGALGISLAAVGGGAAAAIWIVGKALPTFANGMKSFNEVNGDNLEGVGIGLAGIAGGVTMMGGGAVLGVLSAIATLVGGKTPLQQAADELYQFQKLNIDSKKVKQNGEAALIFAGALAGAVLLAGFNKLTDSLNGFFDSKPPFKDFENFSKLDINTPKVKNNATAFKEFAEAMGSYKGGGTVGTVTTVIAESVANHFKVNPPIKELQYFSSLKIDPVQTKKNATAFKYFSEAIAEYKGTNSGIIDSLNALVGSSLLNKLFNLDGPGPVDSFVNFTNKSFGPNAEKNADAFFKFASAMGILTGSPSASGGTGSSVLGGLVSGAAAAGGAVVNAVVGAAEAVASALGFGKVVEAGPGYTTVQDSSGKVVKRTGARNWRNNNPGNLIYGDFAKKNKAIGTDGRFAVFPTYEDGRKAKESLLFEGSGYKNLDISHAIARYAPESENNVTMYINTVSKAAGVPASTPLSALNSSQRHSILSAMEKVEGFKVGKEEVIKAKEGGIFDGPISGYPMELHGTEIVVPMDKDSLLKRLATQAHNEQENILHSFTSTEMDIHHESESDIIVKMDTEMKMVLLDKLSRMLSVIDSRHETAKKILQNTRI